MEKKSLVNINDEAEQDFLYDNFFSISEKTSSTSGYSPSDFGIRNAKKF